MGDDVLDAAVSEDGREIVFVATTGAGVPRLWRRPLASARAEPLPGTEGAAMPAWKATGGVVSFFTAGKLKQIALDTGAVRNLADAPAPAGAAWLPDGSVVFVPDARGPVRRLRAGVVTDATQLGPGERGHGFPAAAEGGFTYLATLSPGRRVARLAAGGAERDLTTTSSHAQLIGGHVLHVRDGTLITQRFDAASGTLESRSTPLAFNVGVSPDGRGFFTASRRLVVWAAAAPRRRELAWFDLAGRRLGTAGEPADYWQVRLSPDDGDAAVTLLDPLLRTLDVFVLPLTRTAPPEQLTLALAADSDPVWAPRGDRILFRSLLGGQPNLYARRVHAPQMEAESVLTSDLDETPSDWQGDTILFHAPAGTHVETWALDIARGTRSPAARRGFSTYDARWSPDGRRIAYASDEGGRPDIYIEPWPLTGQRTRVSFAGGTRPEWGRDGRSVFFLRDGAVMRTDTEGAPAQQVLNAPGLRDYTLARRSDRILAIVPLDRTSVPVAGVIVDWMPQPPPPRGRGAF